MNTLREGEGEGGKKKKTDVPEQSQVGDILNMGDGFTRSNLIVAINECQPGKSYMVTPGDFKQFTQTQVISELISAIIGVPKWVNKLDYQALIDKLFEQILPIIERCYLDDHVSLDSTRKTVSLCPRDLPLTGILADIKLEKNEETGNIEILFIHESRLLFRIVNGKVVN